MCVSIAFMFEDIFRADPRLLHQIYGVNCYAWAIGERIPFAKIDRVNGNTMVSYAFVTPGHYHENPDGVAGKSFQEFIISMCQEDGLEYHGTEIPPKALALFVCETPGKEKDFHFARLREDGRWEDKVPCQMRKTHQSIQEIEVSREVRFVGFFSARQDFAPKTLSAMRERERLEGHPPDGCRILIEDDRFMGLQFMLYKGHFFFYPPIKPVIALPPPVISPDEQSFVPGSPTMSM